MGRRQSNIRVGQIWPDNHCLRRGTSHVEDIVLLRVPPSNYLVSQSRILDLPCALLLKLQRYKDTIMCALLSPEVAGQHQEQLLQTLILHLLKKSVFYLY